MISQVRKCLREAKELALGHTAGERESTPKADLGADPGPPRRLLTISSPVPVPAVSWPGAGLTGRAPYMKQELCADLDAGAFPLGVCIVCTWVSLSLVPALQAGPEPCGSSEACASSQAGSDSPDPPFSTSVHFNCPKIDDRCKENNEA